MSENTTFSRKTFEPNHTIFDEGDPADTVFILRSGAVEIRIGTLGEHPRTLTKIKVGDVFGELALLENRSHGAAAIALEKSEVLEVPREEFITTECFRSSHEDCRQSLGLAVAGDDE